MHASAPVTRTSTGPKLVQVEVRILCQPAVGLFLCCEHAQLREPMGEDSNRGAVGKPTTSSVPSPLAIIARAQSERTQAGSQDACSTWQLAPSTRISCRSKELELQPS